MDLAQHIRRLQAFSSQTFGPGPRTQSILAHIREELLEVEAAPTDLYEWLDIVMLALDGAWRAGRSPEDVAAALETLQTRNEGRTWPDWRTMEAGEKIKHIEPQVAADDTAARGMQLRIWTEAYRPFIMGGDVYRPVATEVEIGHLHIVEAAPDIRIVELTSPYGTQHIAEVTSGALVGNSMNSVLQDIAVAEPAMMARQIADAKVRGRRADNVEPDVFWRLLSRDTRK
jgi:hypothetical protein